MRRIDAQRIEVLSDAAMIFAYHGKQEIEANCESTFGQVIKAAKTDESRPWWRKSFGRVVSFDSQVVIEIP